MDRTYSVVLLHEQDGRYSAVAPAVECATWGHTIPEALRRIEEALACHLETLEAHGERIEAIERPKAEAREKAGKAQADPVESCHRVETGKTRDAVARAVGGMSGRTSEQALW